MSRSYNNNGKLPSVRNNVNDAAMLSTSKRHQEETVDYDLTSAEISPLVVKKKQRNCTTPSMALPLIVTDFTEKLTQELNQNHQNDDDGPVNLYNIDPNIARAASATAVGAAAGFIRHAIINNNQCQSLLLSSAAKTDSTGGTLTVQPSYRRPSMTLPRQITVNTDINTISGHNHAGIMTPEDVKNDLIPVVTSYCGNYMELLESQLEVRVELEGDQLFASFKDAIMKQVYYGEYMFEMLDKEDVDLITVPFKDFYNGQKNHRKFSVNDLWSIQVYVANIRTSWRFGFRPDPESDDIRIHFPPDIIPKKDVKKMHNAQIVIDGSLAADAVEYIDITFGPLSSEQVRAHLVLPTNRIRPFWTMSEVYNELIPTEYKNGELKMVFNSITFRCDAIAGVMKSLREWKKFSSKKPK